MGETLASLQKLLRPRSVAVIGASTDPEKLSGQPLRNLLKGGYKGNVYVVNPNIESIEGVRCHKTVAEIAAPVDVAMICLPAEKAVQAAEQCADVGIPNVIVAVSGFSETNTEEGKALQRRLSAVAERGTRVTGPNCNGIYNVLEDVSLGYNIIHSMNIKKGDIAILSHSGALFSSIVSLGKNFGNGVGYSYFVSVGNEADLTIVDYLEYMIEDPGTKIIGLIIDSISDVQRFGYLAKQAREKGKTLVAIKLGVSETGAKAAQAHSSRMAGSAKNYQALFRKYGIIQAHSIESFVGILAILQKYRIKDKTGLIGVSTSGAGCAILADSADKYGLRFVPLSANTLAAMEKQKGFGVPMNPFDIGASNPVSIGFMSQTMANDEAAGFVLFYSTILQTEKLRRKVAELYSESCKNMGNMPFLVIAPGPLSPEEMDTYQKHDIVVFQSTDAAMDAVRSIIEAKNSVTEDDSPGLEHAPRDGRIAAHHLRPENVWTALQQVGIPVPRQTVVSSVDDVWPACREMGYPVVIKGLSGRFTHKSDLGMVWVGVTGDEQVHEIAAFLKRVADQVALEAVLIQEFVQGEAEVLVGVHKDPDVGYVLLCGSGGKYTEVLDDVGVCLLPASRERIAETLSRTKIGKIIDGYRNNGLSPKPVVDIAYKLQRLLFVHHQPIAAIDLNPVILNPERATVVDARLIIEERKKG